MRLALLLFLCCIYSTALVTSQYLTDAPTLSVCLPQAGSVFFPTGLIQVEWSTFNIYKPSLVHVSLYQKIGGVWSSTVQSVANVSNTGFYAWRLSDTSNVTISSFATSFKLKLRCAEVPTATAFSGEFNWTNTGGAFHAPIPHTTPVDLLLKPVSAVAPNPASTSPSSPFATSFFGMHFQSIYSQSQFPAEITSTRDLFLQGVSFFFSNVSLSVNTYEQFGLGVGFTETTTFLSGPQYFLTTTQVRAPSALSVPISVQNRWFNISFEEARIMAGQTGWRNGKNMVLDLTFNNNPQWSLGGAVMMAQTPVQQSLYYFGDSWAAGTSPTNSNGAAQASVGTPLIRMSCYQTNGSRTGCSTIASQNVTRGFAWHQVTGTQDITGDCMSGSGGSPLLPGCRSAPSVSYYEAPSYGYPRDDGSRLFVFGGRSIGFSGNEYFNDVWVYGYNSLSLAAPQWRRLQASNCVGITNTPSCRHLHTSVVFGPDRHSGVGCNAATGECPELWVIGGRDSLGGALADIHKRQIVAADLVWDDASWSKVADLPFARYGHASVVVGNALFVFGGTNSTHTNNQLYKIDKVSKVGTTLSPGLGSFGAVCNTASASSSTPPCVSEHSFSSHGGFLFLFGGKTNAGAATNALYRYEIASNTWLQIVSSDCERNLYPQCRFGSQIGVWQTYNGFYVYGGSVQERKAEGGALVSANDLWMLGMQNMTTSGLVGLWSRFWENTCHTKAGGHQCTTGHYSRAINASFVVYGGQKVSVGSSVMLNSLWSLRKTPVVTVPPITPVFSADTSSLLTVSGLQFGTDSQAVAVHLTGPVTSKNPIACSSPRVTQPNTQFVCTVPPGVGTDIRVTVYVTELAATQSVPVVLFSYAAPVLLGIEIPTVGQRLPTAGGALLTLVGAHFGPLDSPYAIFVNTATRANISCLSTARLNATAFTCLTPAGAGKHVSFRVSLAGQSSALFTTADGIQFDAPTISSVSVRADQTAGGAWTLVTGTNFGQTQDGARVWIGANPCTATTWLSPTQLNCTAIPPGTGASLIVNVSVGGAFASANPSNAFSYAPPTLTTLAKSANATHIVLEVNGNNFGNSPTGVNRTVTLSGTPCQTTVFSSPTRVVCTSLIPGLIFSVQIYVQGQLSTNALPMTLSQSPPAISSVTLSAAGAPTIGGTRLTILGNNFGTVSSVLVVTIGDSLSACIDPVYVNAGQVTCTIPALLPNQNAFNQAVRMTVDGLPSSPANVFDYDKPAVTSIDRLSVLLPTAGGGVIGIRGFNFGPQPGVSVPILVTVGGAAATNITYTSDELLSCTLPVGAGMATVLVTVGGQISVANGTSSIAPYSVPSVSAILPSHATTEGNISVTIKGSNFGPSPSVMIGSASCLNTVLLNYTHIKCTVAAGAGRGLAVQVTVAGQSSPVTSNGVTFSFDPPTVTNVIWTHANTTGGPWLTLTGTNFGTAANRPQVFVRFSASPTIEWISHTQLRAMLPAGVGKGLRVTLEVGGQSTVAPQRFRYDAPTITQVTIPGGTKPTSGGTKLTVMGSNFGTSTTFADPETPVTIFVATQACLSVQFVSTTQLVCTAPAWAGYHLPMTVVVAGQSGTIDNSGFTYSPPRLERIMYDSASAFTQGGQNLTIQGINFGPQGVLRSVHVGGMPCPSCIGDSFQLVCQTPEGEGAENIVSAVIGGQPSSSASSVDKYEYGKPRVLSVSPKHVSLGVSQRVTVTGVNFGKDSSTIKLTIGGKECGDLVLFVPHQVITCEAPVFDSRSGKGIDMTVNGQLATNQGTIVVEYEFPVISAGTVLIVRVVAPLLILLLFGVLYATWRFRATKEIRASSPLFMALIVLGAIMCVTSVLVTNVHDGVQCHFSYFLVVIGFTTLYGSLLLKNYRILMIFNRKELVAVTIKNWHLSAYIMIMVVGDLALLIPLAINSTCGNPNDTTAWAMIGLLVLYKALMVIAGVVIAFKSRVIAMKEFSERIQLGYAIYNISFSLLILLPVLAMFRTQFQAVYVIRCFGIMLVTLTTVFVIFAPRFYTMYRRVVMGIEEDTGSVGSGMMRSGPSRISMAPTSFRSGTGHPKNLNREQSTSNVQSVSQYMTRNQSESSIQIDSSGDDESDGESSYDRAHRDSDDLTSSSYLQRTSSQQDLPPLPAVQDVEDAFDRMEPQPRPSV